MKMVRRRDDSGFAMVTTVLVVFVAAILAAVILTEGTNADRHSGRDKNWTLALQTADAGVERAVAYLQANNGSVPGSALTGSTTDGTYSTTVSSLSRNRYQIDSSGTVGTAQSLKRTRNIRVVMAPPRSFQYALFSLSDINTKNNNYIQGDVWANGSIEVYNGDTIQGSAYAATGWVHVDQNSTVTGDVKSGGLNAGTSIELDGGATIGGNATAASTVPGCSDDPAHLNYKVSNSGTITGKATTWGSVIGTAALGGNVTGVCSTAPATKTMPVLSFNPVNYSPPAVTYTSVASFQSYVNAHQNDLSGAFYITGNDASIDLTGVNIAGDTTIIATSTPIWANGVGAANNNDKILVMVSLYQPAVGATCTDNGGNPSDCAVAMKNNFQPTDNTATLIYAPNGPVAFKNNATFTGAVYAANIILKNNQDIVYDTRVDQIVGFGPVTLSRDSWLELKS